MQTINGNTSGVKQSILEQLQTIYAMDVPKDLLVSEEIVSVISWATQQLNREISVYINRRGKVVDVSIGDSGTVSLAAISERRNEKNLSGIRCIHTHPSGDAMLSEVDLSALQLLKLDIMSSVGVHEGNPTEIYLAHLTGVAKGNTNIVIEGPYKIEEVYRKNIMLTIREAEKLFRQQPLMETTEERAILVGIQQNEGDERAVASMRELAKLAETAGVAVADIVIQKKGHPDARFFIGQGKAQEISLRRQLNQVDVVIVNHDLSPIQQRNLENTVGCKVIDRTELILDIFAQRAQTKEGKLQVELAQLNYLLPRLIGQGLVLSRLGGGIGTRGPGETKLEMDRRVIRKRISDLQREITHIQKVRDLQRNSRKSVPLPIISLVGYTNAGKSTLLNVLTDADVLAEDKLFATLDPTTRKLTLPSEKIVLLTDTVGFIERIPHHLVAAFRATLEEVVEADLLIHVIDATNPLLDYHIEAVNKVLASLGALDKPTVMVFNKSETLDENEIASVEKKYPVACCISAETGLGIDKLFALIDVVLPYQKTKVEIRLGYDEANKIGTVHSLGKVLKEEYTENEILFEVEVDAIDLARLHKVLGAKEGADDGHK